MNPEIRCESLLSKIWNIFIYHGLVRSCISLFLSLDKNYGGSCQYHETIGVIKAMHVEKVLQQMKLFVWLVIMLCYLNPHDGHCNLVAHWDPWYLEPSLMN